MVSIGELDDPLANSMASFNSAAIPKEGSTFVFGSRICVANGQGGFNSHVANPRKPEAPSLIFSQDVDTLTGGSR
jgi:hypothetical protein